MGGHGVAKQLCSGEDRLGKEVLGHSGLCLLAHLWTVLVRKENEFTDAIVELGDRFKLTLVQTDLNWVEGAAQKFDLGRLGLLSILRDCLTYQRVKFLDKLRLEFLSVSPDCLRFKVLDSGLFALLDHRL